MARTGAGTGRTGPGWWSRLRFPLVVLAIALAVPAFVARVYVIPSGSMETTLHGCDGCTDDRVLVDLVAYRFGDPDPGDILVFRLGDEDLIKRVIAVGGQTVSCCDADDRVLVDGVARPEPYLHFDPAAGPPVQPPFAPVRVPDGSLFVMGDNRNSSLDSRAPEVGTVPVAAVAGKARWIVLPVGRFGPLGG
jgi:signal peptidase I